MNNSSLNSLIQRYEEMIHMNSNPANIRTKFQASLEAIMKSHYDNNIKVIYNNSGANLRLKKQKSNYTSNELKNLAFKSKCQINPYFKTSNCKTDLSFMNSKCRCAVCFATTCINCCSSDKDLGVNFQRYIKKNLTLSPGPSGAMVFDTKYICNACLLTLAESVEQIKLISFPQQPVTFNQSNIQKIYGIIFKGNPTRTSLDRTTRTKCIWIKTYLYDRFPEVLKHLGTQNLRHFLNSLKKYNENVANTMNEGFASVIASLPVANTPPGETKVKNFRNFIEILEAECKMPNIRSTTWLIKLRKYWHTYLSLAFIEPDLSKITKVILKTVLNKSNKNQTFNGDDDDIKNFIKIYNQYLGNQGGPGRPIINQLEAEYTNITQGEVEVLEPAPEPVQRLALLAQGGKKKHKYIKRKKVSVKNVGVYRSKGGYYYRRYKNGKVKRISKEIYKKLK